MLHDIVKPSLTLFIICVVVSFSLAFTHGITKDRIEQREAEDALNARRAVLSQAEEFVKIDDINEFIAEDKSLEAVKEAYIGLKDGSFAGYTVKVKGKGYGGDIVITVGIGENGEVTGVNIGSHSETPGLGAKASGKPFLSQFEGLKSDKPLKVVKGEKKATEEIEAITGATITSKAVTSAIQTAIDMANAISVREAMK